ncbi:hypothetical protein [Prochlorococcus marinus]|nr:hypothetical protein [Prochlorococcus marinus]
MVLQMDVAIESLGTEPKEVLGFDSEEDLELALQDLMREVLDS